MATVSQCKYHQPIGFGHGSETGSFVPSSPGLFLFLTAYLSPQTSPLLTLPTSLDYVFTLIMPLAQSYCLWSPKVLLAMWHFFFTQIIPGLRSTMAFSVFLRYGWCPADSQSSGYSALTCIPQCAMPQLWLTGSYCHSSLHSQQLQTFHTLEIFCLFFNLKSRQIWLYWKVNAPCPWVEIKTTAFIVYVGFAYLFETGSHSLF